MELSDGRRSAWYFLGPRAGGMELEFGDRKILVLTPQSPLGRQLLGQRIGATVQVAGRGKPVVHTIASLA